MSIETELAWAAGFFDGEGCISLQTSQAHIGFQVSINQVDRRPLDRFSAAVGGKVLGPYKRKGVDHQCFYVINYSGKKAMIVLINLWPYMSEPKREQAGRKWFECLELKGCRPRWVRETCSLPFNERVISLSRIGATPPAAR